MQKGTEPNPSYPMTCEDFGLDFRHSSAWCPVCWAQEKQSESLQLQREYLAEKRRDNEIRQAELEFSSGGTYQREQPRPPKVVEEKPKTMRRSL